MGADPRVDDARWLLDWISRTDRAQFTRRDAHLAAPRGRFPKATNLDPALALLEEHGYLRRVDADPSGPQGRPATLPAVPRQPLAPRHRTHTTHTTSPADRFCWFCRFCGHTREPPVRQRSLPCSASPGRRTGPPPLARSLTEPFCGPYRLPGQGNMCSDLYGLPGPVLAPATAVLRPGSPRESGRRYGPSLPRRPRRG